MCLKNLIVVGNILKTDRDVAHKENLNNYLQTLSQMVGENDPLIKKIKGLKI